MISVFAVILIFPSGLVSSFGLVSIILDVSLGDFTSLSLTSIISASFREDFIVSEVFSFSNGEDRVSPPTTSSCFFVINSWLMLGLAFFAGNLLANAFSSSSLTVSPELVTPSRLLFLDSSTTLPFSFSFTSWLGIALGGLDLLVLSSLYARSDTFSNKSLTLPSRNEILSDFSLLSLFIALHSFLEVSSSSFKELISLRTWSASLLVCEFSLRFCVPSVSSFSSSMDLLRLSSLWFSNCISALW